MTDPQILIACIGNIFLGDDGFGTAVALRLANRKLPPGVILKDFGIRGLDLTYALLDPYDLIILVDACRRGEEPGTVYLLAPSLAEYKDSVQVPASFDAHSMDPMSVLRLVRSMGSGLGRVLLVGCEPADMGSDEEGKLGLSDPVEAAIDEAIVMIENLLAKALDGELAETALKSH